MSDKSQFERFYETPLTARPALLEQAQRELELKGPNPTVEHATLLGRCEEILAAREEANGLVSDELSEEYRALHRRSKDAVQQMAMHRLGLRLEQVQGGRGLRRFNAELNRIAADEDLVLKAEKAYPGSREFDPRGANVELLRASPPNGYSSRG